MKKNIVLIGFMGSGKTTIGKLVSQKLGYGFIDSDELIEQKCGMKVSDIFNLYGEEYFREVEARVISEISDYTRVIISCGGGAVKQKSNIDSLRKKGLIIWLKTCIDEIYKRIQYNSVMRPLANGKSKEELEQMMAAREELYKKAHIFIDTSNKTINEIVDEIINIYVNQTPK